MDYEYFCCWSCGVNFAVQRSYAANLKAKEKTFHCPNGCRLSWGESEATILRRERDLLKQRIAQKDDEMRAARERLEKQQKQYRRLEKRTAAGTCPCCKRTFSNMSRHMASQHPEFVRDHTQAVIPEEDKVVPIRRGRRKAS